MNNGFACYVAFVIACVLTAQPVVGQTVAAGDRVRIVDSQSKKALVQGRLVQFVGDSATVAPDGAAATAIGTAWIIGARSSMERSAGMKTTVGRGVGLGLLIGVSTGAIYSASTYEEPTCSEGIVCSDKTRGEYTMEGAIALGLVGMLIGGVTGLVVKHESWKSVNGQPVQARIAPTAGRGVLLSFAMLF